MEAEPVSKQGRTYEKVQRLGSGGQGTVYLARPNQPLIGRPDEFFALKQVSATDLDRFRDELEAVSRLKHDGIVQIVDYSVDPDDPFYVMPVYGRGSLADQAVEQWSMQSRLEFFDRVLRAVAVAHEQRIIHRDLKPENILIGDKGQPVIADWGICYIHDHHKEVVTRTQEVVGARNYRPPEAEVPPCDNHSATFDIYSLGKILYWLIANKFLHRESLKAPAFDLVKLKAESKYQILESIIERAINSEPSERYQSVNKLLDDFLGASRRFLATINHPGHSNSARCIFCGVGQYETASLPNADGSTSAASNQSLSGAGTFGSCRVVACDVCGNVQMFSISKLVGPNKRNPWAARAVTR